MTDGQNFFDSAGWLRKYLGGMEGFLNRRGMMGVAGLLLFLALLGLIDLAFDFGFDVAGGAKGKPLAWQGGVQALVEVLFMVLCIGMAFRLLHEVRRQTLVATELHATLLHHTEERDAWRAKAQDYLQGLGETIAAQFKTWKLTSAERQVALLLLKGFSTQEIALLQERSERTVRQHAITVYSKAKVAGRAELSAFFLEDLLLPADA
jgi:DNA-binding CsgD family transcriptional regulator